MDRSARSLSPSRSGRLCKWLASGRAADINGAFGFRLVPTREVHISISLRYCTPWSSASSVGRGDRLNEINDLARCTQFAFRSPALAACSKWGGLAVIDWKSSAIPGLIGHRCQLFLYSTLVMRSQPEVLSLLPGLSPEFGTLCTSVLIQQHSGP